MAMIGMGIDLLENRRVERELARGSWRPADGIFTAPEIAYCEAGRKPAARYAACFAAKEATLKAFGIEVSDLAFFREAEVHEHCNGQYGVILHNRLRSRSEQMGVREIRLSIAFAVKHTGAIVVLEG